MTTINWNDKELLQEAINKSKSRVQVLKNLGYNSKSAISRRKLNGAIKKFNLNISHFTSRTDRWDNLSNTINGCYSISDVLRSVGLQDMGNNHQTAKRYIKEMNLSTKHFDPRRNCIRGPIRTDEEVFCENSTVHRSTLKKRIIQNNLIKYCCNKCDNSGEWLLETLDLQLDHINGVNNDNRLDNLRFLCPNCHSQTTTYCGKNNGA